MIMDSRDILIYSMASVLIVITLAFSLQSVESAIPPTAAIKEIEVETSHWEASNRLVQSTSYQERIYFVTDGSIIFNVTTTAP
jgi:hypothetical protein